ncbi:MAG: hypothetical protein QOF51_1094 [Chloroflexota bacterium]|nr:hypothetical protein [Chloroflexota bacterium]
MPAEATKRAFDAVGINLAPEDALPGQMFGMPCLKVRGKAFAGLYGDAMVFKLTGDAHARALTLAGARLFDPSGMNRPMKEWVEVPVTQAADWPTLARAALTYVAKR